MISPVKAIIFDADGVLLDSLSIWRELGAGSGMAEKQVRSWAFRRKDSGGSESSDPKLLF